MLAGPITMPGGTLGADAVRPAAEPELDLQQLFEFPVAERHRPPLSPLHRAIESVARELANIPLDSPPAGAASRPARWQPPPPPPPPEEPADLDLLLSQLFDP